MLLSIFLSIFFLQRSPDYIAGDALTKYLQESLYITRLSKLSNENELYHVDAFSFHYTGDKKQLIEYINNYQEINIMIIDVFYLNEKWDSVDSLYGSDQLLVSYQQKEMLLIAPDNNLIYLVIQCVDDKYIGKAKIEMLENVNLIAIYFNGRNKNGKYCLRSILFSNLYL